MCPKRGCSLSIYHHQLSIISIISINPYFYLDNSHKYDYNISMRNSKTKLTILYAVGIVSLVTGLMLYLIYRETSYVSEFINYLLPLRGLRKVFSFAECEFLKFWIPDFLWALSFSAWLHIALIPDFKGSVLCALIVSLSGTVFEFLQQFDVISGTADFWDIIAYISASMLISIKYLFLKEKNK